MCDIGAVALFVQTSWPDRQILARILYDKMKTFLLSLEMWMRKICVSATRYEAE